MTDTDKILQAIEELKSGQQAIKEDLKSLKEGQRNLELKVEAFHSEQKKANDEIIRIFHNIEEVNQEEIEKRVERIEKHLNLPLVK